MTYGPGIEPEEPTHVLTVEIPFRLYGGPFDHIPIQDALKIVLALARCSGGICAEPEATLREVEHADRV